MQFIPIKKELKNINGVQVEVFSICAMNLQQKNDTKARKIPHPLGEDCMYFKTLEEAKNAVIRSGFSVILPDGHQMPVENIVDSDYEKLIFEAITKLTDDKSFTVVASAIATLGEFSSMESFELFLDKMGEDNEFIRTNAINAILKFGNYAVPKLLSVLNDTNWVKVNSAIYVLGELTLNPDVNISEAVIPLLEKLNDSNNIIKTTTITTLGKIYKVLKKQK